jgi:hypothetical protein
MKRGVILLAAILTLSTTNAFAGVTDTGRCETGECVNQAISRWQSQQITIRDAYRHDRFVYGPGVYGAFVFARATLNGALIYKWAYSAGEQRPETARQQAVLTFDGAPGNPIDMVTWNYSEEH